ncbi:MAG: omp-alpha 6 [Firmicutes bacterium]|nr:omp-alpha 6 [Bacillota bacterium]
MRKLFIIVLLVMFSILATGTAFAAKQTFIDVPAKHWAYEAVNKLAKTGIIDGYGDHTFRGDKLITRYEMAQIVLRAMERSDKADIAIQALIEKLAAEFLPELKSMQTRLNTIEKKQSSIKFWGDARIRYQDNWDLRHLSSGEDCLKKERIQERIRLYAKADVSEKTEFFGRISAESTSSETFCKSLDKDSSRKSTLNWEIGKFTFNNPGHNWNVELGRSDVLIGQGLIADTDGGFDSVRINFNTETKNGIKGFYAYGDIAAATGKPFIWDTGDQDRGANVSILNLSWSPNKNWTVTGASLYSHSHYYPYKIFSLGVKGHFEDWTLIAEAARNTSNQRFGDEQYNSFDKSAWLSTLWYKGADKRKEGSWGAFIDYRDIGSRALDGRLSTLEELATPKSDSNSLYGYWHTGVKGFGIGFNYAVDKNVILTATLKQLKTKETNAKYTNLLYVKMDFAF